MVTRDEIRAELLAYLDARIADLIARGMSPAVAEREALRLLGGSLDETVTRLQSSPHTRERPMAIREYLSDCLQDVRYAARGLTRRPGFTAIAVLTLALSIGGTTAIFSAVNTVLLRPLPFQEPEGLMKLSLVVPPVGRRSGSNDMVWSYPKFLAFRDAQRVFSSVTLLGQAQFNVTGSSSAPAERVSGEQIDSRYLPTLGVTVQRGGNFPAEEDAHPDAPKLALISDGYWRRHFGGDPRAVGQSLLLDQQPYRIIGITQPGFQGVSGQAELFVPLATLSAKVLGWTQSHSYFLIARRKPQVSAEQAKSAVVVLGAQISEAFPAGTAQAPQQWSAIARELDGTRVAPALRRSLIVLFAAVSLVLLIACVNLASLLLGRASARRREIGVRLALGARRERLVRLLVTESVLVSVLGGCAGLAVAWWATRMLAGIDPAGALGTGRASALGLVAFSAIHLDGTALLFALGVATIVGMLFGLAPALQATAPSLTSSLKQGDNLASGRRFGGRRLLVVSEVSLAVVLLAASGLMIRSLGKLLAIDPGIDPAQVLTLWLSPPANSHAVDSLPSFYVQLVERLGALPGVKSAALSDCPPVNGGCNATRIQLLDHPIGDRNQLPGVGVHWVTPGWFATMGVGLRRGRPLGDADRLGTPRVVVVNETAARRFWPGENPIGKRIEIGQGEGFDKGAEVVGIVADVRQRLDTLPKPDVYISYAQSPVPWIMVFLRTSGDPLAVVAPARAAIQAIAPDYPVYDVQTMTARLGYATSRTRFNAMLLALFAAVAVALAVVGIYAVMAFMVVQRTREIGIRMALGADRRSVLGMVLGEGIALAAAGSAIGLGAALLLTRVLRSLLYEVQPSDPATYVAIILVFAVVAVLASWIPARRAVRIDPMAAIRAD